jgi:hypothetical protein
MVQLRQAASAQTAVRTSSIAHTSRSQRNVVLQRAMSSRSRIGLKRWRICCRRYVLLLSPSPPPHNPIRHILLPFSNTITCHSPPSCLRVRSSIPEQTLPQSSALPSNVISGLGILLPFQPGQRRQMLPLPSQKIPSAPFPLLLSLALDLKSRNPSTLMKKRADPSGISRFLRTCPVSRSQTSRDGTTAAPLCSL